MAACAVRGCKSNNNKKLKRNKKANGSGKISFFRFPKDEALRKLWLRMCGRSDSELSKFAVVCSKHFQSEDYTTYSRHEMHSYRSSSSLSSNAVPTVHLPNSTAKQDAQNVQGSPSSERWRHEPASTSRREEPHILPSGVKADMTAASTAVGDSHGEASSQIWRQEAASTSRREEADILPSGVKVEMTTASTAVGDSHGDLSAQRWRHEPASTSRREQPDISATIDTKSITTELAEAREKIDLLAAENAFLRYKMATMKDEMQWVDQLFTPGQQRKLKCTNMRVKWTIEDITKAISLYASGPEAYRLLLTRAYPLPAVSTLQRWASKVQTNPGLLSFVFALMRNANLTKFQKVCILLVEEMRVCSAYEYDRKRDTLLAPVNNVQVVTARGIFENWKQPVYYKYDTNTTETMLKKIITKLHDMEYHVVAVVSNLGGENRGLWQKMDINENSPYFSHPGDSAKKVYVFSDTPHLLKLLRNHFLDSGVIIEDKLLTKEPLEELLSRQANSELEIASGITSMHLTVKLAQRQRLRFATQLFSSTVSCAIDRMGTLGLATSQHWREVSLFIKQVNDWFDIFNANLPKIDSASQMVAYGLQMEEQEGVLNAMLAMVQSLRVGRHKSLLPFQRGIVNNIIALRMLYADLQEEYSIKYLLTYRLNQDPLELFFEVICTKGGLHDHPTALQFQYRLRSYLLGCNEWHPAESTNAAPDTSMPVDEPLLEASTSSCSATQESSPTILTSTLLAPLAVSECDMDPVPPAMADLEFDALEYLAGYILHRLQSTIPHILVEYTEGASSTSSTWTDQITEGLRKPTADFVAKLKRLEKIFTDYNAPSIRVGPHYMRNLLRLAAEEDLHIEIKSLFFHCKLYFKIRIMNKCLEEYVKTRKC